MPAADTTLYAQFTPKPYTLTLVANPTAGGVLTGAGSKPYNSSVTVSAAANPGYFFMNWSTNANGTGVVSRKASYTFTMPGNDYTLYANFAKAIFAEGFEGLANGSLDMNDTSGPNQATNGDLTSAQPWWGTSPPNASVGVDTGLAVHTGSKSVFNAGKNGGRDFVNIAYRFNSGSAYIESLYADWWFYDRSGTVWVTGPTGTDYCDDPLSLVYNSQIPTGLDWPTGYGPGSGKDFIDDDYTQKLSLGMADVWTPDTVAPYAPYPGFDNTKYQARIKDGSASGATAYAIGWYNLNMTRSIGWHHGRITVGPLRDDFTNEVKFFIDDMSAPLLTGSANPDGFNGIELVSQWKNGANTDTATINWPKGTMYDDIVLGSMPQPTPAAPVGAAASNLSATSIQWNWTEADTSDGFHVFDAASFGAQKGGNLTATNYNEASLAANTQYSRWVSSYFAPAGPNAPFATFESSRTALAATYTLAAAPVYGTTGNAAVSCSLGQTNTTATLGQSAVFTAVNGFGTGAAKASSYLYVWNSTAGEPTWGGSAWTTGDLTMTPSSTGTYYLHLRAVNGAGAVTATTLNLGPYTFNPAGTPVAKISDLWPLTNGPAYILTNKVVTGVASGSAFWIEETDRSAAIKVVYTGSVTKDNKVDVTGVLDSSSGQRVLSASAVADKGAATAIRSLGVVERTAGGKGVNANTPSITDGKGLYNIAMLVRIAGAAGNSNTGDPNNKFFYLDDGSGLLDGAIPGIKVLCGSAAPPSSGNVIVTGLVGVVGGKPVLTIRDSGDIRIL